MLHLVASGISMVKLTNARDRRVTGKDSASSADYVRGCVGVEPAERRFSCYSITPFVHLFVHWVI